jgi:hypothetical protein
VSAFSGVPDDNPGESLNCKATIIIEHLIQATHTSIWHCAYHAALACVQQVEQAHLPGDVQGVQVWQVGQESCQFLGIKVRLAFFYF